MFRFCVTDDTSFPEYDASLLTMNHSDNLCADGKYVYQQLARRASLRHT